MSIRVVIAEDQALVYAGFRVLLDSAPDIAVLCAGAARHMSPRRGAPPAARRCRQRPYHARALVVRLPASQSGVAVANDLDSRAGEHAAIESYLWLGNTHAHGLHHSMVLKDHRGDSLRDRLGQRNSRSFDDRANLPVHLAIVDGLRQIIAQAGGLKLALQLDIDDELLSQLPLSRERAVTAVEDHSLKPDPIPRHQGHPCAERRAARGSRKV